MKAALLTALETIEVRNVPSPGKPAAGEVRVAVDVVGVCGSDIHYFKEGRIGSQVVEFPWVLGHECAGVVKDIGPGVAHLRVGQRVAVDPLIWCGRCDQCAGGRIHTCRHQKFLGCPGQVGGALAEELMMPATSCFPVPDNVSAVEAALLEPFSIGLYAARLAQLRPGAEVAILGSGPIGLCVLKALRTMQCGRIFMTDLLEPRLSVARRYGADWTGLAGGHDVPADILKCQPLGLDAVFECAGQLETLEQAVRLLKPGGTLMMVGIPAADRIGFNAETLRRRELKLQNVRRQNECVAPAIELVAGGVVELRSLATHEFDLVQSQQAFDLVSGYRDGVIKAMIRLDSRATA